MPTTQHDFTKYESYRHELADFARMFFEQAKSFPGIHFEFVQADTRLNRDEWSALIALHRSTTDDDRESWDVYPAGWAAKEEEQMTYYKLNSPFASDLCGHYFTEMGHLEAARVELEQLATSGMIVLDAIARESESSEAIREIVCLKGRVGYGYRGFLDTVRNTAERHRWASSECLTGELGRGTRCEG